MFHALHRKRRRAVTAVAVIIILALAAVALWYFVLRSTPHKTVSALLDAARKGDEVLMKDHFTERSAGKMDFVISMTRRLAGTEAGEPTYTIEEATVAEKTATVPVEFPISGTIATVTGRESVTVPYVLHREGRTWRVDAQDTQAEIADRFADSFFGALRRFFMPETPSGEGRKTI